MLLVHTMSHITSQNLTDDTEHTTSVCESLPDAGQKTHEVENAISQDLLDIRLPEASKLRGHSPERDDKQTFTQKAVERRLAKYARSGVSAQVRLELGEIEEKMKQAQVSGTMDDIDEQLAKLKPDVEDSSISPIPKENEYDKMMTEYSSLTREASDIRDQIPKASANNQETKDARNPVKKTSTTLLNKICSV